MHLTNENTSRNWNDKAFRSIPNIIHHGFSCYAMVFKILALFFVFYLLRVSCKVYLWTLYITPYIYKSLPRWLRLVVNLGCWKNLVWSNRAAPSTNENKWWLPWALASTALWLLSTSYSYFKCWFIVMQNHPSFRMQYEWHSGHSQWMEKRWEWKDAESAGFWNDGGDCVTGSSCSIAACVPFYPLTLTKRNRRDRLKRNPGERFHRRSHPTYAISRSPAQKVKGSEGGLVRKPFIHHFDLALSWWYEMPPN